MTGARRQLNHPSCSRPRSSAPAPDHGRQAGCGPPEPGGQADSPAGAGRHRPRPGPAGQGEGVGTHIQQQLGGSACSPPLPPAPSRSRPSSSSVFTPLSLACLPCHCLQQLADLPGPPPSGTRAGGQGSTAAGNMITLPSGEALRLGCCAPLPSAATSIQAPFAAAGLSMHAPTRRLGSGDPPPPPPPIPAPQACSWTPPTPARPGPPCCPACGRATPPRLPPAPLSC